MVTRVTKKAKQVKLEWAEETITHYRSKYECPTCKTIYIGTISKTSKVSRFFCDCGQELIVKQFGNQRTK